jgi:8-oxo-dGTP diphosphatase
MGKLITDVAVAIVRNTSGHVLVAERTARQIAPGFWELPGGKIEPGETAAQAAARELAEETGLVAESLQPFMAYDHAFPTKRVRLQMFSVPAWHGTPHGREGQRLAWIDPAAPSVAPILPSNRRVMAALALPPKLRIIELGAPNPALQAHAALSAGIKLLQLREHRLAPDQRVSLARQICLLARDFDARVLVAGSPQETARAGAAGLHSDAATLRITASRPPVLLWSVSCQNADDLVLAEKLGADLAVIPATAAAVAASTNLPAYIADDSGFAHRARRTGDSDAPAVATTIPRAWMLASNAPDGEMHHPK